MSTNRSRRIDRRTAEELLRGGQDRARAAGPDALSDLLAAASAPARSGELAGEQAALAAFRAARLDPVPQVRRRSMLKSTAAKLLTAKIAGVAATALTAGGIAVAAATGHVPAQHDNTPTAPPTSSQVVETTAAVSSEKPAPDKVDNGSTASPSPSLVGLCHAYTAGAGADHGKALDNPAFNVLITTAGGEDKVSAYCADLLGARPGKPSADHPEGESDQHPTGPPGEKHSTVELTHPNGPPSTRPSR